MLNILSLSCTCLSSLTGLKSLHLHQSGYLDPVVGGLMSRITLSVKMKRKVLC